MSLSRMKLSPLIIGMTIGVVAALVVLSALAAAEHRPRAIASKPGALLGLRGGGGVHDDGVTKPLVVVGSLNVDITIEVERLPKKEETVMASSPCTSVAVGGKGANQAAAAARLATGTGRPAVLVCEFGNDGYAETMRTALQEAGVDVSRCAHSAELPTGAGGFVSHRRPRARWLCRRPARPSVADANQRRYGRVRCVDPAGVAAGSPRAAGHAAAARRRRRRHCPQPQRGGRDAA